MVVRLTAPAVRPPRHTTVGALLRQARLQRGSTIAACAHELKIPKRHLQALEDGDTAAFSAEVYARGAFVKYADYLGVRAETNQHAFLRTLAGKRHYLPIRVHTPRPRLANLLTPRWVLAGVIFLIAAVVGSYIIWQLQAFLRLPALTLTEPATLVVSGTAITVQGHAEVESKVTVNGAGVLLNKDGAFTTELVLHPGINVLQVQAENAAGRTHTLVRHLLMPRR